MNISNTNTCSMLGFGEHCNPTSYSKYKIAKNISEIAIALLLTGIVGSVAIATGVILNVGIAVSAPLAIGLAASSSVFTLAAISSVIYYRTCQSSYLEMFDACVGQINQPIALGQFGNCDAIVCDDTMESFEWKKKLIQSAEHNILLSGNYCGGSSFDEILNIIEQQLNQKQSLKVIILSSDKFLSQENKEKIQHLDQNFQDRFQLIQTPDIYHINPGLKKTTNHSKILTIDNGRYFILGGSGIEDKYALAKGLESRSESHVAENGKGLLGWFLPRGFRDQDFIFYSASEQGVGKRIYIETLKLALRWQFLNKLTIFNPSVDVIAEFKQKNDVVNKSLEELQEQQSKASPINTYIAEFHQSPKIIQNAKTKVFCMGPEHNYNPFERELINRFKQTKERIIINHMYFHPTSEVMNALIEAANRGVKIKIITNGYEPKNSPKGHQYFGPRNRCNYNLLKNSVNDEANVSVYEFQVKQTTLHKKVIIVDDYVIAGSSNLGYKSLVTMSDHEINFVTKNKTFAEHVSHISEIDSDVQSKDEKGIEEKGYAKEVNNFDTNLSTLLIAAHHRLLAPLIG